MAYNPPIGSIYHLYTTYILPSGGLYNPYHLLGQPETTIEKNKKTRNQKEGTGEGFFGTGKGGVFFFGTGGVVKVEMARNFQKTSRVGG